MVRRAKKRIVERPSSKRHGPRRSHLQRDPLPVLSVSRPSHNLPIQVTSFIGREREIAEIQQALPHTHLMTLTGAGGCGKTRLALQVAASVVDSYADGVWLVELASLSDSSLVSEAVASALGIPDPPGLPLRETLRRYFQTKSLLLVLDNCEHLLSASADLVQTLLQTCPNLKMLATSREPLGILGEVTWRVSSLSVPDLRQPPDPERLMQYEAVRLFVERAAFSRAGFQITRSNAATVAQVAHRLDGIPLAIELAAARVKALPVDVIAARLDDQFRLLTGGSRTSLPRQQTLRATLDWSYALLSEQERILLQRLSVFAGGFTLEAAERVCAGEELKEGDVLDVLTRLVDKSQAVFDERHGHARYRLLEMVRQYASEQLSGVREEADVRTRHREWCLRLAQQANPELRGPNQRVWLERLEAEHDNLRAALKWSKTEKGGAEVEAQLVGALWWFWFLHGHWNEGRRRLEEVVTMSGASPSALTKPLQGAAFFAWRQNDFPRATALSEQGVTLCRQLGDREGLVWFHHHLGVVALRQGGYHKAEMVFDQGLALARELGDQWLIGVLMAHLAISRASQEDYESAAGLLTESLTTSREIGDRFLIAFVVHNLGYLFLSQGNHGRDAYFFTESLTLSKELQDYYIAHESLEGLAGVVCARERYHQAALLLGATDALRATTGYRFSAHREPGHDRYTATARAALLDAEFATAWAKGRAMTLEQAIEYALECASPAKSRAAGDQRLGKDRAVDLLTAREREVAALVASGLTNRQIAAKFVVTERTAETHVHNILNKLGFTSRAQIAAWAVEQGLRMPAEE